MKLTERPEHRSVVAAAQSLAVILALGFCVFLATPVLNDPDSWWHIRVGRDIWQTKSFPVVDVYSHTFSGQPWIAKEWLSQILFYAAHAAGGWNGTVILTVFVLTLTAWMLARALLESIEPIYAMTGMFATLALASPGFLARPHIFTFPLGVIWTWRLFKSADSQRSPEYWLLLVLLAWVNLHASYTLAFVIVGAAFLQVLQLTGLKDRKLVGRWLGFLMLCPLVSLFNPYGVEPLLIGGKLASSNAAMRTIVEWQPFSMSDYPAQTAVLFATLAALALGRPNLGLARTLVALLFLYMFLRYTRFGYLFFVFLPVALAPVLARDFPRLSLTRWNAGQLNQFEYWLARARLPLLAALTMLIVSAFAFLALKSTEPPESVSARGAIAFAVRGGLAGNVLNNYNFGGPLIYHNIPTFIDGRTDQLFLGAFFEQTVKSSSAIGEAEFDRQLIEYDVTWTLLNPADGRNVFLARKAGWRKIYADAHAIIYRRE